MAMMAATLRQVPYFADLDDARLRALAASVREKTCGAGTMVLLEGEPCQGLGFVVSGRVKVFKMSADGRYIAFESTARNLVTGYSLTNYSNSYLHDTQTGTTVLVNTSAEGAPHRNKSLVVVPLRQAGKRVRGVEMRKIRKVGMWCSDTAQIFFDEVRVPQRHRIGDEGMGFVYQMKQFQEERLSAAARRLASLALIDETSAYLRQRVAFGRPLLDNQYIQYKLAELKTELEALRGLVHLATETYIAGGNVVELASMAKLKAGRLSREIADWCVQFQGGMGYTWDNRASRALRDWRLGSIGGGADEVMLNVIARQMGLMGG